MMAPGAAAMNAEETVAIVERAQRRFSGRSYMAKDAAEEEGKWPSAGGGAVSGGGGPGLAGGEEVAQRRTCEELALMDRAREDAFEETDYATQAGRDGHEESMEDVQKGAEDLRAAEAQRGNLAEARIWTRKQSGASTEQAMPLAEEGLANLMGASWQVACLHEEGAAGTERNGGEGVRDEQDGSGGVVGGVDTCQLAGPLKTRGGTLATRRSLVAGA
ncbi:hypothetical protein CYMTET_47479 [Cymbomonas tetramitiformis]|uniref:Uncharacterized protein n=1 Tax=Cymbomonas tetramitiformis TaxID=36881 RepID=A0AAE0BVN2_9CHLO|nr:hypothetical protein CYMTET_47479 [Cymbomonas tetramitiformis]